MDLKTSTSRRHLKPYREPYWVKFPSALLKGASLGFRRSPDTGAESWHVRVYSDGKYHTSNLGSVRNEFEYKEAFRSALEWAQAVKHSPSTIRESFTLQDVLDEYLNKLQGNSSSRSIEKRDRAESRLNALVPEQLRKRKIDSISAREIVQLQLRYQQRKNSKGRPIANESVNRIMTHLIAALNHGYRSSMIETDNAWKHYQALPPEPHKRKPHGYVESAERDRFITECQDDLKAFVSALHYLAARPSELCRLRVSDVALDQNLVRLLTYKGTARTRDFPLPKGSAIRELLKSLIEGKDGNEHVFQTQKKKPWTQANLAKAHNRVSARISMPGHFDTYSWRHCRITDFARAGFPAPEVAALTATSLEFIQKNYYKPDSTLQAQMACL
jgi:integrase